MFPMKRAKCQLYAIVPAVSLLTALTAPLALASATDGSVVKQTPSLDPCGVIRARDKELRE